MIKSARTTTAAALVAALLALPVCATLAQDAAQTNAPEDLSTKILTPNYKVSTAILPNSTLTVAVK